MVGAGGIGCAIGHALRSGGIDVTFVEADPAKVAWGNEHGVGLGDQPSLPTQFLSFDTWQPPENAIVLLCTKCFHTEAVLARLPDSVAVMPIQNGFHQQLIERSAIEGIASFVSECRWGQTHTDITRPGELHVGRWQGGDGRPIQGVLEALLGVLAEHGQFKLKRVASVLPYKYTKLMYNAAIAPLAAVAGIDNSQLLTIAKARKLFFQMLRENYRTLKQAGIELGVIGPFHPDTVDKILRMPLVARIMSWPFARSLKNTYCSMSGDIAKGQTEIDYFNGHLLELAGDLAVPLNRRAHALVHRMSRERVTPALVWLDELLAPEGADATVTESQAPSS